MSSSQRVVRVVQFLCTVVNNIEQQVMNAVFSGANKAAVHKFSKNLGFTSKF